MISTFDLAKLHSLLQDFYSLTKIRITIFNDSFEEITSYPDSVAPFCQMIRSCESGLDKCRACDKKACETAARRRSLYTYRCHAGLTESIAPIIMGNIVIGYLLFGHVFSYASYEEGWAVIEPLCRSYPLDLHALKKAARQQPLISDDYIVSASHIMQAVASYLCMERMVALKQQELPVQIDTYIQEHYTEDISVSSIAEYFQIGKTKIYEIAKQNYGIGIAEQIRKLRIEKAKRLLREQRELSLSQIASKCGFDDYNYFITVFRRMVGVPPRTYAMSQSE